MQRTLTVALRGGLHARPAAQLVQLAKSLDALIELERNGVIASARSSVKLMLLALRESDKVTVRASGNDANSALELVSAFLSSAGEGNSHAQTIPAPLKFVRPDAGVPVSSGAALGPAFTYFPTVLPEPDTKNKSLVIGQEEERLRNALARATESLLERRSSLSENSPTHGIVQALIELSSDPEWYDDMITRVNNGDNAYAAAMHSGAALAARFDAVDDAITKARAEDLRSLTRSLGCELLGLKSPTLQDVPAGAVIVADELTAMDLSTVDMTKIAALVCRRGASTSHSAIVARAYGVPAVFGLDIASESLRSARRVAVDGDAGMVHLDPDKTLEQEFLQRIDAAATARLELRTFRDLAPRTRNGREVIVAANLGSLREVDIAREAGAMGVGLFRTELLFMEQRILPSEDEQTQTYRELAKAFYPHGVIIRTLDIGGDKPINGIEIQREDNPFLGWRGVRLCLDRPDVFRPQLLALLRAAEIGNIKVMIPMISELDELLRVRQIIEDCKAELNSRRVSFGHFDLGIMIETPSAVLQAEELAAHADFFSIGTNDLTQYIMAADRANSRIASLYRTEQPSVLKAIKLTCDAARRAGIWIGVCGEAAANPALIPQFLEMGVTELSMSPSSILKSKKFISEL